MPDEATLRLRPNLLKTGETATVRAEHLPARLLGQACRLELVEVDDRGEQPSVLATFDVTAQAGGAAPRFASAARVDAPTPAAGAAPKVVLAFDGAPGAHEVVIAAPRTTAEGQFLELGLTLRDPSGAEVYPAGRPRPFARLDCGPTPFVASIWADPDDPGGQGPGYTDAELETIRGHAQAIWKKNGFDVEWRIVKAADGVKRMAEAGGPTQAFCRVVQQEYGGSGQTLIEHNRTLPGAPWPGAGIRDAWVFGSRAGSADRLYQAAYLAAHEVLHQYLGYAWWYLFQEKLGEGESSDHGAPTCAHESTPYEEQVEGGFPRGMQNLNCQGIYTRIPAAPAGELRPGEQIILRQRRLLETLFTEVRQGTLDQWRRRLKPWLRAGAQKKSSYWAGEPWTPSFEWKAFYDELADRGPPPGPPPELLALRPAIDELEAAAKAEGEARLARAKQLYEEGKKPFYADDDELKFREALSLVKSIHPDLTAEHCHKVRNFTATAAQRAELDRLKALLESEL